MWTREDLEAACDRFETTKQYGNKIEIADFFTTKSVEKLLSYRETLALIHDSGLRWIDFDGYKTADGVIMWRRHDGRTLPDLENTHRQGVKIKTAPQIGAAVAQNAPEPCNVTGDAEKRLKRQAIEIGRLSLDNSELRKTVETLKSRIAELEAFYNS